MDYELPLTGLLLGTIAVLQVYAAISVWMDRESRRESTGGIHDRLDVLMGRRCAWCDKHLGNGALELPKEQTCACPATADTRARPHDQAPSAASTDKSGNATPVPARRRRRRRRRPRSRPRNGGRKE